MLHHVALEITPHDAPRSVEMWELIGFEVVEVPPALAERFLWVERAGTQIHLALTDRPIVPPVGHPAVVVPDLDEAVGRLRDTGFEVFEKGTHWGARRMGVIAPGGHRVEMMEAPPRTD
jgi:hypothetical protein